MKLSIYLDDNNEGLLFKTLQDELQMKASQIVQAALIMYAESRGLKLVPARVERFPARIERKEDQ